MRVGVDPSPFMPLEPIRHLDLLRDLLDTGVRPPAVMAGSLGLKLVGTLGILAAAHKFNLLPAWEQTVQHLAKAGILSRQT